MGLSDEGSAVALYSSEECIKDFKVKLCSHPRGIPINELVENIKSTEVPDIDFWVMFTVLVMYTILAPGSGVVIPLRYLHGAVDVENLSNKNWSKWSFDFLVAGLRKFKMSKCQQYVSGNLLFLQVCNPCCIVVFTYIVFAYRICVFCCPILTIKTYLWFCRPCSLKRPLPGCHLSLGR